MSVVTKKDGRIACVYTDSDGKQQWEYYGRGADARRAAEAKDLEVKLKKKRGTFWQGSGASPFRDIAQEYINYRQTELSAKTREEILRFLTLYVLPVIGD